ncbi:MAG: leucyl/phenylalanyl-tRNA--protein transferase [Flavobacteriales bacterium]|nr:leucyl/phenylalanyl-tRNA--protein transferase [Flavobacteriales bacterium]
MPVYRLPKNEIWFPPPSEFDDDVVAVGADLSYERLLSAYSLGIFPWYNPGEEVLWWCPAQRCVLFLDELKISRSMRNVLNRGQFTVTLDKDFLKVMQGCGEPRPDQDGTWVSQDFIESYSQLHQEGFAHSVEVRTDGELVGGLYGVSLGNMFFGESMFSRQSNASKAALIFLVDVLNKKQFSMIDCQVYNPHLGSMGARNISRSAFLQKLHEGLEKETLRGSWNSFAEKT